MYIKYRHFYFLIFSKSKSKLTYIFFYERRLFVIIIFTLDVSPEFKNEIMNITNKSLLTFLFLILSIELFKKFILLLKYNYI